MANALTTIEIDDRALREALAEAIRRVRDPGAMLDTIGQLMEGQLQARFDAKRDPDGAAWAPWAESTRRQYDRRDTQAGGPRAGEVVRGGSLLESRLRLMRNSITHNFGEDYVEWGMNRQAGKSDWQVPLLHEFGTRRMPRRGLLFSDPEAGTLGAGDRELIDQELIDWMNGLFD